jgi:catechol 2,3-dioxygenase-like lactoylglutathione lyase family enzyme
MNYTGMNHLAMVTGNMDATVRFWRDLLGMRLIAGLGRPGYRQYFFEISDRDAIAFFEWPGVEKGPDRDHGTPVEGPAVFDHLALGVENDDALWELKDRLEAVDIWVSEIVDHGFIHSLYSFDPNNIPIEFSAPVDRIDLRREPRMADAMPIPAAEEGPDPVPRHWPQVKRPTPVDDRRIYPGEGQHLFARGEDDEMHPV